MSASRNTAWIVETWQHAEAIWAWLVQRGHSALDWATAWWAELRDRHQHLMDTDPRYPVALAAGGGAVIRVVIGNPDVAKAVSTLVADLLSVADPTAPVRPGPHPVESWRPPASSGHHDRPLWERDDWDDEE